MKQQKGNVEIMETCCLFAVKLHIGKETVKERRKLQGRRTFG